MNLNLESKKLFIEWVDSWLKGSLEGIDNRINELERCETEEQLLYFYGVLLLSMVNNVPLVNFYCFKESIEKDNNFHPIKDCKECDFSLSDMDRKKCKHPNKNNLNKIKNEREILIKTIRDLYINNKEPKGEIYQSFEIEDVIENYIKLKNINKGE
jgi:hypothetical protein